MAVAGGWLVTELLGVSDVVTAGDGVARGHITILTVQYSTVQYTPQSTEVFYLDNGEPKIGPIEKVYVTTLVTPLGLASSFNGRISKIIDKK